MNEIPNRIIYSDIETVSDLLLRLNQELSLKMNVRFGHTNMKTNERESYIKGYLIDGQRYPDNPRVVSIKRDFDYYLSIESWSNRTMYFQMRPVNMISVLNAFNRAYNWLVNEKLWKYRDNTLYLINEPDEIFIYNLYPKDVTVGIKATVMYDDQGNFCRGIRLTIGDRLNFSDIGMNNFGAMCYILKTLDMYTAACTIVNSLPSVYLEPTFVKNLVYYNPEMTSKVEDTSKIEGVSSKGNRVPPGLKKKTTIDDLG